MVSFRVGNGRRVRFWEDVWWGEEAFSNQFRDLYRLFLVSNGTIADMVVSQPGSLSHGSDFKFYRNFHE